jgi:hypothetical protein
VDGGSFLEECDQEEHVAVNGASTASGFKRRLSNVTYWPSQHCAGFPTINIQSSLRIAPHLCKRVSLQCYLVVTLMRIQSIRSQVCVHTYICSSQYGDAGRAKEVVKKLG